MSDSAQSPEADQQTRGRGRQYVVVARRYRPQTFEELIGQEHVAQALSNAIATDRVGHAYLFTGVRGVGKTSAARILAKALNCTRGPAPLPCNQCDICQSISSGDDVDVLEIDGASNRGIDEIRQLRQNVNVRPSRARFKIYIIDEVHMLTREAFNALLKTLEEPPQHVKFIFCTTEPTKIPITILSRCQRFDFSGIQTGSIRKRLEQIAEAEGVEAEPEALDVLARRAAGSMRDSQSLLEQLLAFSPGRVTLGDVHEMLGTAGDERLGALVKHLVDRDAAAALADLDAAVNEGVDVALLLEQLLGYFRDCMLAAANCPAELLLYASPSSQAEVIEASKRLGLQTILAVMQIVDQTLARLRFSAQSRILAELALVRICQLEDLEEISALVAQLQTGGSAGAPSAAARAASGSAAAHSAPAAPAPPPAAPSPPPAGKKNAESAVIPPGGSAAEAPAGPFLVLTAENAAEIWTRAIGKLTGIIVEHAGQFHRAAVTDSNCLVIRFKPGYAFQKSCCERPEPRARFEQALAEVTGRPVRVEFAVEEDAADRPELSAEPVRVVSPQQRLREVVKHPMVCRAGELFGAQPLRVDDPSQRE